MPDDSQLLRRYAEDRSQEAFAELVERHLTLVYSAALRQAGGDAHLAQDVTQMVFVDLARKAAVLAQRPMLAGWLHTSTRFAAAKAVRTERRRQAREEKAHLMQEIFHNPDSHLDWERVRPVLDEALGELGELDREAVLLRFFEGQKLATVGARLALTETAARSRVDRALEKLRGLLARRGVASTSAALGLVLANQASVAAPVGLAATVTGASVAAGAAAGGGWAALFMSMTKLQLGIAGAIAVAGATGYISQGQTNAALRQEIAALQAQKASIAALQVENRQLANAVAEVEVLRQDDAELARLSQEVGKAQEAQRLRNERAKISSAQNVWNNNAAQELLSVVDQQRKKVSKLADQYKDLVQKFNDPSFAAVAKVNADVTARVQITMNSLFRELQTQQQILNSLVQRSLETDALLSEEARATQTNSTAPDKRPEIDRLLSEQAAAVPSRSTAPNKGEATNPPQSGGILKSPSGP